MARHHVSRMLPALFHPEIAAHNGGLPNAAMLRRIANSYNSMSTQQKKLLFLKWQDFRHMTVPVNQPADVWPFYFRTGENATELEVHIGITHTDPAAFPGFQPFVVVDVFRASDNTRMNVEEDGEVLCSSETSGSAIGAQDISHLSMRIRGLASNTEYYSVTRCHFGMRLAYLSVHEVPKPEADDLTNVVCNPAAFITEGPIKRVPLQDLNIAAKLLWRHNASHLFSWCPNYDEGDGPSTNSTSYVDLIPNSAAMRIETTNRGTLHRPNAIPVKIAVKALRTAGAGTADFRMFDGTNSVQITGAAINSSRRWYTGTGTLSGTPANWRLQHRVSVGTTTVFTMGFCCFQFEA